MTNEKKRGELSTREQALVERLTAAVGVRIDRFLRQLETAFRSRVDELYTVGAVDADTADRIERALFDAVATAVGPIPGSTQDEPRDDEVDEERD